MNNWNIIPLISVGPFKFTSNISQLMVEYKLTFSECADATGWDMYKMTEPRMEIYTEKGAIVSIACRETCSLENMELIGLGINDFISLIRESPSEKDSLYVYGEQEPQLVYEFEDHGLQVWTRKKKL